MGLFRLVIIAIIMVGCSLFAKVYAGSVNMVTYYPAPNGYYDSLSIKSKLIIPCYKTSLGCTSAPSNAFFYEKDECVDTCPWR